jgi:release factor glutamine methyltransferase
MIFRVSQTLGLLLAEVATALSAAGFNDPRRLARCLAAGALDVSLAETLSHSRRVLSIEEVSRVAIFLRRVLAREPLTRILGRREFWGMEFLLSVDTLDPRPETETVIEALLRQFRDRGAPLRVLDLGTGTGCILLAFLSEFRRASGVGIDIAPSAAMSARRNAIALGLADRADFVVGDWGSAVSGRFDVIVANPPYIATSLLTDLSREVTLYDPSRALDGGADGLSAYRLLAPDLNRLLTPRGIFACEVGLGQAGLVKEILRTNGFEIEGCERDLAGILRCVVARPCSSAPNSTQSG